jgi:primosomal protein N' (replication factor Y)
MPLVHIVDMRREISEAGQPRLFSQVLLDAIKQRLDKGEQTLLFLNRRGYSTSLVCPSCGYVATCEACDIAYTYHRHDDCLRCHICGGWKRVADRCPQCGDPKYKCLGTGTQRIEQIVSACFPHARIARMDADSTSRKFSHDDILGAFKSGKTDILIGTQMIAKGLHFPNVTLVGIVMADSSLHIPDFRAGERTFQLLAQVSGRTGRGAIAGEVYVQTYTPDHPAVQMARTENFEGFADGELEIRRDLNYPPYCHLTCLTLSGPEESAVAALLERIAESVRDKADKSVIISEVVPASLPKANNQFRYQLLLRAPTTSRILPPLSAALAANRVPEAMRLSVDVDALSLF